MTATTTTRLPGQDAVDHARETGAKLSAYADPLEDASTGLAWDSDAVTERLRVDPGLVYLDAECPICRGYDSFNGPNVPCSMHADTLLYARWAQDALACS